MKRIASVCRLLPTHTPRPSGRRRRRRGDGSPRAQPGGRRRAVRRGALRHRSHGARKAIPCRTPASTWGRSPRGAVSPFLKDFTPSETTRGRGQIYNRENGRELQLRDAPCCAMPTARDPAVHRSRLIGRTQIGSRGAGAGRSPHRDRRSAPLGAGRADHRLAGVLPTFAPSSSDLRRTTTIGSARSSLRFGFTAELSIVALGWLASAAALLGSGPETWRNAATALITLSAAR